MTQYPIKLGWAITLYKSQGLSFDNVYLLNYQSGFAPGLIYYALSRCRSLAELKFNRDLVKGDVSINKRVRQFSALKNEDDRAAKVIQQVLKLID